MKRILLSVLAAGLIAVAHAQVPGTLSYQGILVNSSGSPVADGTHYVQFRFYDDPVLSAGANLKYSSLGVGTGNDVVTYKGMFTFLIGSGSTGNAAIPTNIWNSQLWVEVTADGAVLAPRIQLSSNAYAFKAQAANTMDAAGLTGTANLPTTVLDADLQDLADGSLTGSKVSGLPAANISGSVAVANGGTGAATLTGALIGSGTSAITGVAASGASQYFRRNAANTAYEFAALPSDVTSVGLTMPSIFSVSGSPVTTSGTLATSLATQTANTIFAGPSTGAPLAPTFRALVANDIPSLDAGKITTGSLPIALGGTGGTTVSAARTNLGLDLAATTASNGLTLTGNNMSLGGTLAANTSISSGGFNLLFVGTGKMGVGSAVPLSKFNVGGNMAIGNAYTDAFAAPTNGLIVQGITGLGTSSPLSQLDVEGNLAVGTSYSGNIAAPTNGAIIEGNVGIGTNAPALKLDVNGSSIFRGYTGINRTSPLGSSLFDIDGTALAGSYLGMYINGSNASSFPFYGYATAGTPRAWTYWDGGTSTWKLNIGGDRLTVNSSGNLGIGTTVPGTSRLNLNIADATNPTGLFIQNNYTGASSKYGIDVNVDGSGSGTKYGISSSVVGLAADASTIQGYQVSMTPNGTGAAYGVASNISSVGTGTRIGFYNVLAQGATNTSAVYGLFSSITDSGTGDAYGVYTTGEDKNYFDGNVGINTTSPDANLSVSGTASKTGGGSWATFSDKRVKKDVHSFSDGLAQLLKINPVRFKYNGFAGYEDDGKEYIGVIAQDIQRVAPYMISTIKKKLAETDSSETELLMYDASALNYILVNSVKEQQTQIEELKSAIEELKSKLSQYEGLSAQVEELKKMISGKSDEKSSGAVAVGSDKK